MQSFKHKCLNITLVYFNDRIYLLLDLDKELNVLHIIAISFLIIPQIYMSTNSFTIVVNLIYFTL